jgi:hypothetical protein
MDRPPARHCEQLAPSYFRFIERALDALKCVYPSRPAFVCDYHGLDQQQPHSLNHFVAFVGRQLIADSLNGQRRFVAPPGAIGQCVQQRDRFTLEPRRNWRWRRRAHWIVS